MERKTPKKIIVEYEDGTKKELEKDVTAYFENSMFSLDMAQFEKTDIVRLTYALICALHQMGLSDMLVKYIKGEIQVE